VNADATRYPLTWPRGWRRTPPTQRKRARFGKAEMIPGDMPRYRSKRQLSIGDAISRLAGELRRLGADKVLLSTNARARLDGLPYADATNPADPGAAVYFTLSRKDQCFAADRWDRLADNIAAIAEHVSALRAIERYGVGELAQAFAGYVALPSGVEQWWDVLEVEPRCSITEVQEAFRRLAKLAHPDAGGSHDAMARLTAARSAAMRALT
jgi:hypothetical protein